MRLRLYKEYPVYQITKFLWHLYGFKYVYHAIRLIDIDIAAAFVHHKNALTHTSIIKIKKHNSITCYVRWIDRQCKSQILPMHVIQIRNFINNANCSKYHRFPKLSCCLEKNICAYGSKMNPLIHRHGFALNDCFD